MPAWQENNQRKGLPLSRDAPVTASAGWHEKLPKFEFAIYSWHSGHGDARMSRAEYKDLSIFSNPSSLPSTAKTNVLGAQGMRQTWLVYPTLSSQPRQGCKLPKTLESLELAGSGAMWQSTKPTRTGSARRRTSLPRVFQSSARLPRDLVHSAT